MKFLACIIFSMLCCGLTYAGFPTVQISDKDATAIVDVNSSGQLAVADGKKSALCAIYAVSADSTTATQLRPANATRTAIYITNAGAQVVYISTYAATSTAGLYPLAANGTPEDTFIDNNQPYTGAWYGMTTAGQAAQDMRIIEKSE